MEDQRQRMQGEIDRRDDVIARQGGVGGLLGVKVAIGGSTAAPTGVFYPIYDRNGDAEDYLTSTRIPSPSTNMRPLARPKRDAPAISSTNQIHFFHRFSTKYQGEQSKLLYYGYRYYDLISGRWLNRNPIDEKGSLITIKPFVKDFSRNNDKYKPENIYGFLLNAIPAMFDPDGRNPLLVAGGTAVAAGTGGLIYWATSSCCLKKIEAAFVEGEAEADRVAPDKTTHRRPSLDLGEDADALTHCITACMPASQKGTYPCYGKDGVYNTLQSQESFKYIWSQMDYKNNEAGFGLGMSLGPGGDCTQGCLDHLEKGLLYESDGTTIFPSKSEE